MKNIIKKGIVFLVCAWVLFCLLLILVAEPVHYEHFTDMGILEMFVRISAALPVLGVMLLVIINSK